MAAVGERVEPEHHGVLLVGEDRVGEELAQHRPAARAERGRVVHDFVVRQHGQRGVEVVETRVHQGQPDDRDPEELLRLRVRPPVGPEARPGEDPAPHHQAVALALVDVLGPVQLPIAVPGEPVEVGGSFGGPLDVPEPGSQHLPVQDGGPVGREDHVGQPRRRLDDLHRVAEAQVQLPQGGPLGEGEGGVDRLAGVHPGVDRAADVEVQRLAHEEAARGRDADALCGGGLDERGGDRVRCRHVDLW